MDGDGAWLDRAMPTGDHDLVLFGVQRNCVHPDQGPLVSHASAFHGLVERERAS